MGRIGVSPEQWNSAVTSAATQMTNVKGATITELQKTTWYA